MNPVYSIVVLLSFFAVSTFAQVPVKGYYRKDGTYVSPHQRTYPNSTVWDNYSYPGNYNPNTGRITGGTSYPSSTYSTPTSNSKSNNLSGGSLPDNNSLSDVKSLDFTPMKGGKIRFNANKYGITKKDFNSTIMGYGQVLTQPKNTSIEIDKNTLTVIANGKIKRYTIYNFGFYTPVGFGNMVANGGCKSIGLMSGSNFYEAIYCKYDTDVKGNTNPVKEYGETLTIANKDTYEIARYELVTSTNSK